MSYKLFHTVRIVLCAGFFVGLLAAAPAGAEPYRVEGIQVDVTADNALNARNQAFEQAQQEAFKALAAQFLPEDRMASFQPPDAVTLSTMIQDYEVTQEKLSSQRYIGTYTFRFKERAVHKYLPESLEMRSAAVTAGMEAPQSPPPREEVEPSQEAVPGPADSALPANKTLLVLPFFQQGRRMVLWLTPNPWMQAWQRARLKGNLILPMGDLSDVSDIGDDQARSYDHTKFRRMLGRYEAGEAVIAVAVPDLDMAQAVQDNVPAYGTLRIDLYRTDRTVPEYAGQVTIATQGEKTISQVLDEAVTQVQQKLQGAWKNEQEERKENQEIFSSLRPPVAFPLQASPSSSPGRTLEARVKFKNLQEWATVRRALSRVPGLGDVGLKSLAPREARVRLMFQGDEESLKLALQQENLVLADGAGGYDLFMNEGEGPSLPSDTVPSYTPAYTPPYSPSFGAPQIPRPYNNRF